MNGAERAASFYVLDLQTCVNDANIYYFTRKGWGGFTPPVSGPTAKVLRAFIQHMEGF